MCSDRVQGYKKDYMAQHYVLTSWLFWIIFQQHISILKQAFNNEKVSEQLQSSDVWKTRHTCLKQTFFPFFLFIWLFTVIL